MLYKLYCLNLEYRKVTNCNIVAEDNLLEEGK